IRSGFHAETTGSTGTLRGLLGLKKVGDPVLERSLGEGVRGSARTVVRRGAGTLVVVQGGHHHGGDAQGGHGNGGAQDGDPAAPAPGAGSAARSGAGRGGMSRRAV